MCSAFTLHIPCIRPKQHSKIHVFNTFNKINVEKKPNRFVLSSKESKDELNSLPISWSKEKGLRFFGIESTPEIWAIILVYFVQGILGISRLALTFYYKDTLHLGPAELSLISSISVIPWIIKPLYGFISDTFPLFGYKRRSYLILSGLLGSISWGILSFLSSSRFIDSSIVYTDTIAIVSTVLLVMMSSLAIAFSDVLVDAIVVSKTHKNNAGALQSICWSSTSIGAIISSLFSGTLVQKYGSPLVFKITACIPLIIAGVSGLIQEEKIPSSKYFHVHNKSLNILQLLRLQLKTIWLEVSKKSLLYPIIFLVLWQSTPSSGSALFYFEVNELGFTPEFLSRLGLISSLSSLVGIMIYNKKLKSVPLHTIFKWTCISGSILGMTPLLLVTHFNRVIGLSDTWFAIGDDIILTVLGQIAFMPILVLAAKLCPSGIEAMLYAVLMSVNNLSGTVAGVLGSLLTKGLGITEHNFDNLPLLIIITNLSGLLPLAFLKLLPKETDMHNDQEDKDN